MPKLMQATLKFVMQIPRWPTTQVYSFQQVEMDDDHVETRQSHEVLCDFTYLKWQWTKVGSGFSLEVFFCSKFKRKPRGRKHIGKTGTKVVTQSKMVRRVALFHYFPRYCRCHSNHALKTEYGAVKMVLYRAKIPDRRSCSVGSRVES